MPGFSLLIDRKILERQGGFVIHDALWRTVSVLTDGLEFDYQACQLLSLWDCPGSGRHPLDLQVWQR
ncbi:MAG: hypothetical protein GTO40_16890 [Deltaproteobacteria bacterium]|nr:hypothetical protein [Deltaproteobacteria bacterium]